MPRFDGESERLAASEKILFCRGNRLRCIHSPTTASGGVGKQADMPSCIKGNPPYPNTPRLTLVNSTAPDNKRSSSGQSDWSALMAKAQDGDRDA